MTDAELLTHILNQLDANGPIEPPQAHIPLNLIATIATTRAKQITGPKQTAHDLLPIMWLDGFIAGAEFIQRKTTPHT